MTLYAGMGASAAISGGYELGEAIAAHDTQVENALVAYEARLRPFIKQHQRMAPLRSEIAVHGLAGEGAIKNRLGAWAAPQARARAARHSARAARRKGELVEP